MEVLLFMRILVTGASGFLGSWICRLLSSNFETFALIRPSSNLHRIGDLEKLNVISSEEAHWGEVIREYKPDVLILADWWGVGNIHRNNLEQIDNLKRMLIVGEAAKASGVNLVIGLGSQAELGPVLDDISEKLIDNPTSEYARAKIACRLAMQNIFHSTETRFVWMRIFSTYGPLDDGPWLIPQLVDSITRKKVMDLTDGIQEWSYLHAYDFASAVLAVVKKTDLQGIIHVGNPETITIKDAVAIVGRLMNGEDLLNFGVVQYRPDQVMRMKPICETLTSIGWKPSISFEEGIKQTVEWLTNNTISPIQTLTGERLLFNFPSRT
jgi:nucleoside-diphosphate-sugar epimerase